MSLPTRAELKQYIASNPMKRDEKYQKIKKTIFEEIEKKMKEAVLMNPTLKNIVVSVECPADCDSELYRKNIIKDIEKTGDWKAEYVNNYGYGRGSPYFSVKGDL